MQEGAPLKFQHHPAPVGLQLPGRILLIHTKAPSGPPQLYLGVLEGSVGWHTVLCDLLSLAPSESHSPHPTPGAP